jgi:hypothetical protein
VTPGLCRLGYETDERGISAQFSIGPRDDFVFHNAQIGSGAYTTPLQWLPEYFPGVKAAVG